MRISNDMNLFSTQSGTKLIFGKQASEQGTFFCNTPLPAPSLRWDGYLIVRLLLLSAH